MVLRDIGDYRVCLTNFRQCIISSALGDQESLAFRWDPGQKHITVDYIKAHKAAFTESMREQYFKDGEERKVLTFHFLYKAEDAKTKQMEIFTCNMTFHLFTRGSDNNWMAVYSFPRWMPLLDGVYLSPKFSIAIGKAVSFKRKEVVKTGGGFVGGLFGGGGAKKEVEKEEVGKSAAEIRKEKMLGYELPALSAEYEYGFAQKLKENLAVYDFALLFVNLIRLHTVAMNFEMKNVSEFDETKDSFLADCLSFLQNPCVSLLHRTRTYLGLLLSIGKRNNFGPHLWDRFVAHFTELLLVVEVLDVNLYFLFPALER